MLKGKRKYTRTFIIRPSQYGKCVEHTVEVDFSKLGVGITRRLAFTTLIVQLQQDIRTGRCSELMKECIQKGGLKLDVR